MKQILSLLLPITVLALAGSCGSKINCLNQTYYFIWFYTGSANDTLPDTLAIAIPYQQGTNFQTVADTGKQSKFFISGNKKMIQLQQIRSDCDLFDWKIALIPSGRTYLLKDFAHFGKTRRQGGTTDRDCYNDLGVTVNDSAMRFTGDGYRTDIYVRY